MVAEPPVIESRDPSELDGKRGPSQSPAAVRARAYRARRKSGEPAQAQGRPRKARTGGKPRTPRTPKTLYPEIAAFLTMTNTLVTMTPLGSKYEPTGNFTQTEIAPGMVIPFPEMRMISLGDELDEMEIMHLAKSLDAQCQRSPRFKKYVETFLGAAAGGGIVAIVGLIAARRAARHGLIDPSLDPKLGAILQGDLGTLASFTPPQAMDETEDPESGERPPVPDIEIESDPRMGFDGLA